MRKWLAVVSVLLVLLFIVPVAAGPFIESEIRSRTEAYLRARFQSDVQFTSFDIALYPRPRVIINGLTLRLKGRTDVPPLIQTQRVSFAASVPDVLRQRYTIEKVH